MDDNSLNYRSNISKVLPEEVFKHALDMIEDMGSPDGYRNRMMEFLNEGSLNEDAGLICTCSHHECYDIHHEFLLYLDGWLWKLVPDNDNCECDHMRAYHLNHVYV